jgi:hypothetical protein
MKDQDSSDNKKGRQHFVLHEAPKAWLKPIGYKFGEQKLVFQSGTEMVSIAGGHWKLIFSTGIDFILPEKWKIEFDGVDDIFIASVPYKGFSYGQWIFVSPNSVDAYRYDRFLYTRFDRKLLNKKEWAKRERARNSASDSNDDEDDIMRALGSGDGDAFGF